MMLSDRQEGEVLTTEPLQPDRSLSELFHALTADVSTLFRKEVELAKVEARDELQRSGRVAGMFAGAGVGGWMALLFISLSIAWLLDQAMNTALAFAIVGIVWGLAALVLTKRARREMKDMQAIPQTIETLKEDVQWARTRKS